MGLTRMWSNTNRIGAFDLVQGRLLSMLLLAIVFGNLLREPENSLHNLPKKKNALQMPLPSGNRIVCSMRIINQR